MVELHSVEKEVAVENAVEEVQMVVPIVVVDAVEGGRNPAVRREVVGNLLAVVVGKVVVLRSLEAEVAGIRNPAEEESLLEEDLDYSSLTLIVAYSLCDL